MTRATWPLVPLPTAPVSPTSDADVDDQTWDAFLCRVSRGNLQQSSVWARSKRISGTRVVRAVVRRGGQIVGGAQLLLRGVGPLGALAYVPYGPVCEDESPELVDELIEELRKTALRHRIALMVIQPRDVGIAAGLARAGCVVSPVEVAPSATFRIPLPVGAEIALASLRPSTRRNIRLTEDAGVAVRTLAPNEVGSFYRLYQASAARQGFAPVPLPHLVERVRPDTEQSQVRMFVAELHGTPLAAVFIEGFDGVATYKLTGAIPQPRIRPADLVVWRAIQWAAQAGYREFDLGGIPRSAAMQLLSGEKAHEHGSTEFKRGFRGATVLYPPPYLLAASPFAQAALPTLLRSRALVDLATAAANWLRHAGGN